MSSFLLHCTPRGPEGVRGTGKAQGNAGGNGGGWTEEKKKKGREGRENGDEPEGAEGTLRLTGGILEWLFEWTKGGRGNLGWNSLQEDYREEKGLRGRPEWGQRTVIDAGANKGRWGKGVQGKGKRCRVGRRKQEEERKEEKSEGMLVLGKMKKGIGHY